LLGQGPVLHCGAFGCSEKRNFEKQINHLLCGQCRQCYLQAEVKWRWHQCGTGRLWSFFWCAL